MIVPHFTRQQYCAVLSEIKYYKCVEQEKAKTGHPAESKENPSTEKPKTKQVGGVVFSLRTSYCAKVEG